MFEGGGVKGLGLAYALQAFENRGYTHWRSLAGTSAGAIMAAYMAMPRTTAKSAINLCLNTPWADFQDWGHTHGAVDLLKLHGLCRGDVFHDWMKKTLKDALGKRRDARFGDVLDEHGESRLRMIATDITRKKMLVLPRDLSDYADQAGNPIKWQDFLIADAVRMSMSIPYFFAPCHMTTAKKAPAATPDESSDSVAPGTECTIVDGGVLSNFPIWLFDADPSANPSRPTFGFFITGGKGFGSGADHLVSIAGWPVEMAVDMFHTASGAWDEQFHAHSTIVRTCPVPVDGLGTTDFALVKKYAPKLAKSATKAANTFLNNFDLAAYRNGYGNAIQP